MKKNCLWVAMEDPAKNSFNDPEEVSFEFRIFVFSVFVLINKLSSVILLYVFVIFICY